MEVSAKASHLGDFMHSIPCFGCKNSLRPLDFKFLPALLLLPRLRQGRPSWAYKKPFPFVSHPLPAPVAQGALAEGQAQEGRHQVGLAADPGREPAPTGQEVGVAESLGVVLVRALGWAVM